MKFAPLLSTLTLATVLATAPCYAIEIQNFRSGLLCDIDAESPEGDVSVSWICVETETIYVTGQGQCTYDGHAEKCTWYGFEFDYSDASEDDEITCVSASSLPVNIGTPKGIEEKDVTIHEWSFTVPPGKGHHFNPQYSVSRANTDHQTVNDSETLCSVDGKELYRFRQTTIYPALSKDAVREAMKRRLRKAEKKQDKEL